MYHPPKQDPQPWSKPPTLGEVGRHRAMIHMQCLAWTAWVRTLPLPFVIT